MGHRRRLQSGTRMSVFQNAITVCIVLIAMAQDQQYDGQVNPRFCVTAFSPTQGQITKIRPASSLIPDPPPAATSNTILPMALGNKNKNNDSDDTSSVFWKDIGKKPGNLIILPFVALVGIDLLLNIIFITKRSVEYFLLGQAPSTETWF